QDDPGALSQLERGPITPVSRRERDLRPSDNEFVFAQYLVVPYGDRGVLSGDGAVVPIQGDHAHPDLVFHSSRYNAGRYSRGWNSEDQMASGPVADPADSEQIRQRQQPVCEGELVTVGRRADSDTR